ncbi:MAG: hypothetical protein QXP36_03685 [Conexivisphaerales archaeon]
MKYDKKNIEEYVDLPPSKIFEILKSKIEGRKEFEVIFKDNYGELTIYIYYHHIQNKYELSIARFINLAYAGLKSEYIYVPDNAITGTGHLYTHRLGEPTTAIGAEGRLIRVFRLNKTLVITNIS